MDGQIVADFITTGKMLADMIQGGILKLGGTDNSNGLFQLLDKEGKTCVQMNNAGIQLADGTGIIGGDGVYTSLSFNGLSDSSSKIVGEGNFQTVGFSSTGLGTLNKLYSFIDVFVPKNFTLKKAYLNLQHLPFIVQNTVGNIAGYGVCPNMKLYKTDVNSQQIYVAPASDTSLGGTANLEEVTVLGSNGWTPVRPTSEDSIQLEQKSVELDINDFNAEGITRFAVGSSANTPSITGQDINADMIAAYKASGAVIATIVLIRISKRYLFLIVKKEQTK